ncbi:MAG: hypothetical protein ABH954_02770 [Candidatus Omnitrophota bacterium]
MPDQQATQEATNQNCAGCNKQLRKVKRYYRNSKYYCSKKCFKNKLKKAGQENTGE